MAREQYRRSSLHNRSTTSANVDQEGIESADEHVLFADDEEFSGGWRRHTEISKDWVDVFSTPILSIIITYIYHPIVQKETFESVQERYSASLQPVPQLPSDLEPDIINLALDANSCAFKLVGMLLKALGNIKVGLLLISSNLRRHFLSVFYEISLGQTIIKTLHAYAKGTGRPSHITS